MFIVSGALKKNDKSLLMLSVYKRGQRFKEKCGVILLQRWHKYYPKFPELYSRRINSLILIITALKYLTEC